MDDKRFDHIVKNKLESLNPPFREEAWKALDYRLDLLAPLPWYVRWKSMLVAGSLGVITLLNIGLLYKVDKEQNQLEQLVTLLNGVKSPDTVFVSSENYLGSSFLKAENLDGLRLTASYARADYLDPYTIYRITDAVKTNRFSSTVSELAASSRKEAALPVYEELQSTEGANVPQSGLTVSRPVIGISSIDPFEQQYQLNTPDGESMYVRGIVLPPSKRKWKHPVDPRIGVSIGYLIPDPDIGERFVTSRQSLLIETPIRGNFHLLSGLSYQETTYKLDDVDDNNFEQTTLLKYPDFGSFASSPDEITVDNTILQVPIYLRYYKPLNRSWSVFAGGGPTVDILLKQKFTYSFLDIRDEQLVKFDEVREVNDVKVTLGSFSGNMGVEHYFNGRFSAQVELNYQYGLGKVGQENRSFDSFAVSGGLFYKLNNPRR